VARRIARTISHVAITSVFLCALALLIALVVPIDPLETPATTLEIVASRVHTLRFHVALAVAIAALWLLLARRWRFAAIGVVVTLWAVLPTLWWPIAGRVPLAEAASLRVASFNLGGELAREPLVMAEIEAANADIVIILEYTPQWRSRLSDRLSKAYPYRVETARRDNFGVAVFSRVEWTAHEHFTFADSDTPQYRFELLLGEAPILLYAIHILPPSRQGYTRHRAQFAGLIQRMDKEARPLVVAGDFNFVDHGPLAGALHARGFVDAHALAGSGRGATWPVNDWLRHLPGIRIDHVYVGRGLTATDSWVGGNFESDHLPISATLTWAAE